MKNLSLYIHIPFCKTICLYCNFLTFAHKNKQIPDYLEALSKEIEQKSKNFKNYNVETIFFGGGTPSQLEAKQIENIIKNLHKNFKIIQNPEISIECNPESLDLPKIKHYQKMGITRISLGIQSFDKRTLFRIARPHDHITILKALDAIKKSGFKNYGADFIIGLPYQTLQNFKDQLKQILSHKIPHLSFYFLSYDTKKIDLFQADCPEEKNQIQMYEYLTKTLRKARYIHYEVSNYAKPGFECEHNLRYWHQKEYLGLGLGAHSYLVDAKSSPFCTENELNFDTYLKNPLSIHEKVEIDPELDKMEYIMLHLRTHEGINLNEYQKKFKDKKELLEKAQPYLENKKMKHENGALKATEKGFLILDHITQNLI